MHEHLNFARTPEWVRRVPSEANRRYYGGGRACKLTQRVIDEIGMALDNGHHLLAACRAAGISHTTFYDYLKRGHADAARREQLADNGVDVGEESMFEKFYRRVSRALFTAENRLLGAVNQSADGGEWRAAAWALERRFPTRWAPERLGTGDTAESGAVRRILLVPEKAESVEAWEGDMKRISDGQTIYLPAQDDERVEVDDEVNMDDLR